VLKLKFVNAFFYTEATVAAPSCSLFSWICSSVHSVLCTDWQSDVQNLTF